MVHHIVTTVKKNVGLFWVKKSTTGKEKTCDAKKEED